MGNLDLLFAEMRLEIFLGHSDQCTICRSTFLAREDGCPHCGAGARTIKLHPLEVEEKEWDMEGFPVEIWNLDLALYPIIVNAGDFTPWPKK